MPAPALDFKVDETLPGTKYRIVRSLGAGGMGVVYQVVKPPNIQGVLKLMTADLARHEEHRVRFMDEVRILAQLDHPNIVRVFDYDALEDGTPFYVMEVLTGRTVRDVLHTMGRVPPRVAYEITRQLLEALQAAHTHEVPVIHRDVKPENIFLHAPRHGEPVVKLIDFGVSSVADRKHDGAFVGTWSYAAPEQIRGEAPTPATDLYAAGLVLYEMLCGVGPFDHYDDWARVSEAQLTEIPDPVSMRAPWVPASIVSLIQSALAKDPRSRPRDAYSFAERLFELEWASDGKNPRDLTIEGPTSSSVDALQRARAAMDAAPTRDAEASPGPGPLSKILSSVTQARASSKNMAAASPAADRLGDVPLIGVPPENVRAGVTWQGVGGKDFTSPDTQALLAGLGVAGGKPVSKKERESNPDVGAAAAGAVGERSPSSPEVKPDAPRTPRVVVRDEAAPAVAHDATTMEADESSPHGLPVVRESGPELKSARDTFTSQQTDPGPPAPRGKTGTLLAAAAVLAVGFAIATVIVKRGEGVDVTTTPPAVTAVAAIAAPPVVTATPAVAATATAAPVVSAEAAPAASVAPAASAVVMKASTKPKASASGGAPAKKAPAVDGASAAPRAPAAPAPSAKSGDDFIRAF